jgi:hypothetical protein
MQGSNVLPSLKGGPRATSMCQSSRPLASKPSKAPASAVSEEEKAPAPRGPARVPAGCIDRIERYLDRRPDADSFETLTIDGHVRNCQQQQVAIVHRKAEAARASYCRY